MTNQLYNVAEARRHRDRHAAVQHSARAAAEADFARRRQCEVRYRAVRLDRHAGAGAAGHLGLAHRAGAQPRRSARATRSAWAPPRRRPTTTFCRRWSTACSAPRCRSVTGYIGQNEINLAVERGEVEGNNTGLSNITVNKADWLRDGKVRILLQYGAERLPALPDVPAAAELAGAEEDRALLRFYAVKFNMARPLCSAARGSARAARGIARGVRRHHEGPALPRGGPAHRPRRQSARRRADRSADPAGAGDAGTGGRAACANCSPRRSRGDWQA